MRSPSVVYDLICRKLDKERAHLALTMRLCVCVKVEGIYSRSNKLECLLLFALKTNFTQSDVTVKFT